MGRYSLCSLSDILKFLYNDISMHVHGSLIFYLNIFIYAMKNHVIRRELLGVHIVDF
jgi:hypothetical protein